MLQLASHNNLISKILVIVSQTTSLCYERRDGAEAVGEDDGADDGDGDDEEPLAL